MVQASNEHPRRRYEESMEDPELVHAELIWFGRINVPGIRNTEAAILVRRDVTR
jgi:hypothetical protein